MIAAGLSLLSQVMILCCGQNDHGSHLAEQLTCLMLLLAYLEHCCKFVADEFVVFFHIVFVCWCDAVGVVAKISTTGVFILIITVLVYS